MKENFLDNFPIDPIQLQQYSNVLLGGVFVAFFLNITFYKKNYSFFSLEYHRYKIAVLFLVFGLFYLVMAVPGVVIYPLTGVIIHAAMACFSVLSFIYLFYFWRKDSIVNISKDIADEINTRYQIEDRLINKNKQLEWAERTARICYCNWDVLKNEIVFSDGAEDVLNIDTRKPMSFKELKSIVIPEDQGKIQRFAGSFDGLQEIRSFLFRIIVSNKLKYIQINAEMQGNGEQITFIRGTFQDVTEQQMFIKNIEDKNETLEQIAWTQSHDVRGPVATMLGLLSLIDETEFCSDHNKTIIAGFKDATHELDTIIKRIVKQAESANVN